MCLHMWQVIVFLSVKKPICMVNYRFVLFCTLLIANIIIICDLQLSIERNVRQHTSIMDMSLSTNYRHNINLLFISHVTRFTEYVNNCISINVGIWYLMSTDNRIKKKGIQTPHSQNSPKIENINAKLIPHDKHIHDLLGTGTAVNKDTFGYSYVKGEKRNNNDSIKVVPGKGL